MKRTNHQKLTFNESINKINNNDFENLLMFDWKQLTDDYCFPKINDIVEAVNNITKKLLVLNCIYERCLLDLTLGNVKGVDGWFNTELEFKSALEEFYNALKSQIEKYDDYSVEAIRFIENGGLRQLQKQVDDIKNIVIPHFETALNKEKLTTIFNRLKEGGYFNAGTTIEQWLCICGKGLLTETIEPIDWIRENNILARLIVVLFGKNNQTKLWNITKRVFTVKGKKPNISLLKNYKAKLNNEWLGKSSNITDLENLLKDIVDIK